MPQITVECDQAILDACLANGRALRPVALRAPKNGDTFVGLNGFDRVQCSQETYPAAHYRLIVEPIPAPWKPMSWLPKRGWLYESATNHWCWTSAKPQETCDQCFVCNEQAKVIVIHELTAAYDPDRAEPFVPPTAETYTAGDWRCVDLSQFAEKQS